MRILIWCCEFHVHQLVYLERINQVFYARMLITCILLHFSFIKASTLFTTKVLSPRGIMFEVINRQLGLNVSKAGSNKLIAARTLDRLCMRFGWHKIIFHLWYSETVKNTIDKICINFYIEIQLQILILF